MNFVMVRSELQAIIALALIERGKLRTPFVFFAPHKGEDSRSVTTYYDKISQTALLTVHLTKYHCIIANIAAALTLFVASFIALFTHGNIFVAAINYQALGLALKLNPLSRIVTFDDGSANVQIREGSYHQETPPAGTGIYKLIQRVLFPVGVSQFCRTRIAKHYTIYRDRKNIVEANLIECVNIEWGSLLSQHDIEKLSGPVHSIMLGSVYEEIGDSNWREQFLWAAPRSDIYLPHPREKSRPSVDINVLHCDAPAESVINYLNASSANRLTVFHFNSSVALTFVGNSEIEFVDLLGLTLPPKSGSEEWTRRTTLVPAQIAKPFSGCG
jgi:hypothetical protein